MVLSDEKKIMIISVPIGSNKPYSVNKTEFWVKNGADKRRACREELFRLMQSSSRLCAEEMETGVEITEFDFFYFFGSFIEWFTEKP